MLLDKDHYINLKDGSFDSTSKADLDHLFTTLSTAPNRAKLAVFFHGGLTSAESGMNGAQHIMDCYQDIRAYPVFFIWETGLLDVLSMNLNQIYNEPIFQQLLMRVTQFTQAKVMQSAGASEAHGLGLELPDEHEVWGELHQPANGQLPLSAVNPRTLPENEKLGDAEKAQFQEVLSNDPVIRQESQAIANSFLSPDEVQAGTQRLQVRASAHTLMSPSVVNSMREVAARQGTDNPELFPFMLIVEQAVEVLTRVVNRLAQRRDHGLYATVIEEILRQFYLANVGKAIWDDMKQETIDAFGADPNKYAGTAFLQGLQNYCAGGQRPHITLIGHSAGSIYICHFLQEAAKYLPCDLTFDIVLLAPACTFELFSTVLAQCAQRIAAVRLFGMSDQVEQADVLVPLAYPHSLLYLVSGVFEDEADTPILGMQRYYTGEVPYTMQDVLSSFTYFTISQRERTVWSLINGGDGLSSSATKHGSFYNDAPTVKSLGYILSQELQNGSK